MACFGEAVKEVELLEDSTLVSLTYGEFDALSRLNADACALGQRITESQLQYMAKRVELFRSQDSETRYTMFLELFPNLYGRVQNQHVASYLGLSPGTISRILSGKMQKKWE